MAEQLSLFTKKGPEIPKGFEIRTIRVSGVLIVEKKPDKNHCQTKQTTIAAVSVVKAKFKTKFAVQIYRCFPNFLSLILVANKFCSPVDCCV